MNNFRVHVKNIAILEWEPISGTPVFPFNYGQLLDERLNEAYVTVMNSAVKSYRPTTEIRVDLVESARDPDQKITSQYYIVASDNSYEFPVGSGKYKHKLYLLERTKLLEGVMCQSITFTNTKGTVYSKSATKVINTNAFDGDNIYGMEGYFSNITFEKYISPLQINSMLDTVPMQSIIDEIKTRFKKLDIGVSVEKKKDNKVVIKNGNGVIEYLADGDYSKTYNIELKNTTLSITYEIHLELSVYDVFYYPSVSITYNFISVENRYPLKPYTIKDCVERVLDLAHPLYQGDAPKYRLDPLQAAELDKIPAPEFTMTQCNLREQLKIIGGYIHAEPRLDENDVIHFDLFDSDEVGSVDAPYVYNGVSQHINEYCTQIDTSASNIVNAMSYAQGVVFAPNDKNFRTIRTESAYARVLESNGFIQTQFPIHEVVKVECCIYNQDTTNGMYALDPVDITPYVFEATAYFSNLSSYETAYPRSKSYAIYYTIGQKNIQGLFFKVENAVSNALEYYSIVNILSAVSGMTASKVRDMIGGEEGTYVGNLAFRVSYIPIYNTRFTHGKPLVDYDDIEYTRPYNQSENLIETRYYGENIKGVAARLGNVEQERTYIFNKDRYNLQRVPKIGQMLDGYAISAVNVSYNWGFVKCTVALSKDFNRISQYVGISSNKRVYEVSERQTYARNVLLKEYVTVGTNEPYERGIFRSFDGLRSIFANGTGITPITAVSAQGVTSSGNANPSVMLPVISSAFGNTMTFSWSYKDNYSAGDKVEYKASGGVSGFWQDDVPYCDYYGRMTYYKFTMLMSEDIDTENAEKNMATVLPQADYISGANRDGISTDHVKPYLIRKDSREIINMNFAVEFKSNMKSLIVGSAMASNCGLVNANRKKPYLYRLDKKVSKFQLKMTELPEERSEVWVSPSGNKIYLALPDTVGVEMDIPTAWVICLPIERNSVQYEDENGVVSTVDELTGGDIILACNDPAGFLAEAPRNEDNTPCIYLNIARHIYN